MLSKAVNRGVTDPLIACPWGCGDRFDESLLEIHSGVCAKVIVPCYLGCGETNLFREELVPHAREQCPRRRTRCPQGCIDVVALNELEAHVRDVCAKTEIECPQGCGARSLREEMTVHAMRRCNFRPHPCKMCGESFAHNKFFGHINNKCPKRPVACRNGCAEEVLADVQMEHETETCQRRPMDCECGLT